MGEALPDVQALPQCKKGLDLHWPHWCELSVASVLF